MIGFRPDLAYHTAVCFYLLEDYSLAFTKLGEIIEAGIEQYPELNVGQNRNAKSIGNSQALRQSYLIEAFNLKAAIEYQSKSCKWFFNLRWGS